MDDAVNTNCEVREKELPPLIDASKESVLANAKNAIQEIFQQFSAVDKAACRNKDIFFRFENKMLSIRRKFHFEVDIPHKFPLKALVLYDTSDNISEIESPVETQFILVTETPQTLPDVDVCTAQNAHRGTLSKRLDEESFSRVIFRRNLYNKKGNRVVIPDCVVNTRAFAKTHQCQVGSLTMSLEHLTENTEHLLEKMLSPGIVEHIHEINLETRDGTCKKNLFLAPDTVAFDDSEARKPMKRTASALFEKAHEVKSLGRLNKRENIWLMYMHKSHFCENYRKVVLELPDNDITVENVFNSFQNVNWIRIYREEKRGVICFDDPSDVLTCPPTVNVTIIKDESETVNISLRCVIICRWDAISREAKATGNGQRNKQGLMKEQTCPSEYLTGKPIAELELYCFQGRGHEVIINLPHLNIKLDSLYGAFPNAEWIKVYNSEKVAFVHFPTEQGVLDCPCRVTAKTLKEEIHLDCEPAERVFKIKRQLRLEEEGIVPKQKRRKTMNHPGKKSKKPKKSRKPDNYMEATGRNRPDTPSADQENMPEASNDPEAKINEQGSVEQQNITVQTERLDNPLRLEEEGIVPKKRRKTMNHPEKKSKKPKKSRKPDNYMEATGRNRPDTPSADQENMPEASSDPEAKINEQGSVEQQNITVQTENAKTETTLPLQIKNGVANV